ncbi:MAG TPA: hypothetical protein VI094_19240 [Propionibacteriaceae bacterium]
MFNKATAPVAEPASDVTEPLEPLVPLSVLQLDLDAPVGGWASYLADRHIEVVADDIGRMSVSRDAARLLFAEEREREERQARHRKLVEAKAVADDQLRRSQIWGGVPAEALPVGVSASSVMLQAARDAQPKRQSVLQHALANSGEMVFHPIRDEGDAS